LLFTTSGQEAEQVYSYNPEPAQGGICWVVRRTCPGHGISRYDTKWPILCWCATVTWSRPPHWLYLQTPPWPNPNHNSRM